MMDFKGKVVLITGGRSGIGAACAMAFSQAGATVVTAQRQPDANHESIVTDFSDASVPAKLIDQIIARHGRLDVLVNNAGMMLEGNVMEFSPEDWAKTLQVNLTAPFLLIKSIKLNSLHKRPKFYDMHYIEFKLYVEFDNAVD